MADMIGVWYIVHVSGGVTVDGSLPGHLVLEADQSQHH